MKLTASSPVYLFQNSIALTHFSGIMHIFDTFSPHVLICPAKVLSAI